MIEFVEMVKGLTTLEVSLIGTTIISFVCAVHFGVNNRQLSEQADKAIIALNDAERNEERLLNDITNWLLIKDDEIIDIKGKIEREGVKKSSLLNSLKNIEEALSDFRHGGGFSDITTVTDVKEEVREGIVKKTLASSKIKYNGIRKPPIDNQDEVDKYFSGLPMNTPSFVFVYDDINNIEPGFMGDRINIEDHEEPDRMGHERNDIRDKNNNIKEK